MLININSIFRYNEFYIFKDTTYLKSLITELRSSWMEYCSNPLNEPSELQRENIRGVSSA